MNSFKMLWLAVVSSTLAVVLSQEHHCCTPDVWEGEIHSAAGYVTTGSHDAKWIHQRDFIIYDYTAKMSSYSHHTFYEDGTDRSFRILHHYNAKRGYFIEENECRIYNLSSEMERFCVSSTAESLPPTFYGVGEHTLPAVRYYERTVRDGADVGARIFSASEHGCIPIETVEFSEETSHGGGSSKFDIVRGSTYANIVPEVTDRDELEPPATCVETGLPMPEELKHIANYQIFMNHITK